MKTSLVNKKVNNEYFLSTESKLYLSKNHVDEIDKNWIKLPTPKYIIMFYTKGMQSEEDTLKSVNCKFEDF
jgi:hypothetical protein